MKTGVNISSPFYPGGRKIDKFSDRKVELPLWRSFINGFFLVERLMETKILIQIYIAFSFSVFVGGVIQFKLSQPFINPFCFISVKQIKTEPDYHENNT